MIGGPFYYLEKGLRRRKVGIFLGMLFAFFCVLSSFGIGNMTQANSMSIALNDTFHVPGVVTGLVLAVVVGSLVLNIREVPDAFLLIVRSAFTGTAAAGGFTGAAVASAMRFGIARGIFSNEAGLGSAPMAHATARTSHSVRQGLIAMLGPFIDTIVICTMTGLVIVSTGAWQTGKTSTSLSIHAFNSQIGFAGDVIVTLGMVLFAFITILTWSFYGKQCLSYFVEKVSKDIGFYRFFLKVYYSVFLVGIVVGAGVVDLPQAVKYLEGIWLFSDITNALMAIPNLVGLIFLNRVVVRLLKDYFRKG